MSLIFVLCILLTLSIGLVLFLQQQLDYATSKAARQIMNGTVQQNAYSSTDFRAQVVCSYLPAIFSCSDVIVNVQTVTEGINPGGYYAFLNSDTTGLVIPQLSNGSTQYNVGTQGSYEYLQVIYPITFLPSVVTALLTSHTYNGSPAYLAMATAAFRNEQY
ncbi:pilus assembly protein [Hyphomicrobiales bacterium BP6-180914]|uniref:Pilus assembly protein n=1 Tax=Lichenifustis flavocetrariae TaxID=2949735 RepID=A0AA41Z6U7_9HYPH|nr:pilus assembly protein [Lichenifustis flavocetrariae]